MDVAVDAQDSEFRMYRHRLWDSRGLRVVAESLGLAGCEVSKILDFGVRKTLNPKLLNWTGVSGAKVANKRCPGMLQGSG